MLTCGLACVLTPVPERTYPCKLRFPESESVLMRYLTIILAAAIWLGGIAAFVFSFFMPREAADYVLLVRLGLSGFCTFVGWLVFRTR